MALFKNKYRIETARHKGWDYSNVGFYFITICTKNKELLFGNIINGTVVLSYEGEIASQFWLEIPSHFDNCVIDEYIIMPNHIHGIINIVSRDEAMPRLNEDEVSTHLRDKDEAMPRLYGGEYPGMSKISPLPKSLSVIIGSYKSIVTKTFNRKYQSQNIIWQERFYDRIIRNDEELGAIRQYIKENPEKWERDRNNIEGLYI